MTGRLRTAALCVALVASLAAVTPRIYASDEIQYYSYLRSLWFDRDVSFENEYQHFYDLGISRTPGFHETFLERTTETGKRINFGTIGSAILWSPFYAVADIMARTTGRWPADGYSTPYIAAVAFGSAVYGAVALLLSLAIARRAGIPSTGAVAAVWLGTPLCFYMYVAPPMAHACSAFAVALFLYVWLRVRERWSPAGLAALGALAALMGMVREQDLLIAVGPALDFVRTVVQSARGRRPSLPRPAVLIANAMWSVAAFAAAFSPQALAYLSLNGRIGPSQLVTRKMNWTAPHALEVLASPSHGFLVWTPLAALAIAGLIWLAWRDQPIHWIIDMRQVAICALLMVAVQVYIAGSLESWTVAGAFGQRRFVALTSLLVLGLSALFACAGPSLRPILATASAIAIWWNIGLMAQFGLGLMDRQRLEPARNAWTTFLVLPARMPEIVWRYAFDRDSFYQGRAAPAGSTSGMDRP